MNEQSKKSLAAVIFPGFELLDFYGPLEMFGVLGMVAPPGIEITVVAETMQAVKSYQGPAAQPDASFADGAEYDMILLPGGFGTRTQETNLEMLDWLTEAATHAQTVMTVCTGSALLACTGVLDGKRATTNKMLFDDMATRGPKTEWVRQARWVEDGKFVTSSGVSAGMDMALAVIARDYGVKVAESIAIGTEYEWHKDADHDPFAKIHGLV